MIESLQSVGTFEHGSIAGSTIWRAASRPAWLTVGLVLVSLVVGCLITGMRFDLWLLAGIFLLYQSIFFFAAVMFLERKMIRLALLAECNLLLSLVAVIVCMTNVVTASSALPLRDALLIDVDSYVGFSWLATIQWFQEQPAISRLLSTAYLTLHKQVPFLLVALAVFRPTYLRQFGSSWCLTLLSTIIIFPFMPALGGYLHYGLPAADFPDILPTIAWDHRELFEPARAGAVRSLDANAFTGIVTFPSFHAAGAVLLAFAWWQVPGLRYPGGALNAAMLVSVIPCGGHYLSDLIAGCGIAGAITWAVGRYFGHTERSDLDVLPESVSVIWKRHARLFGDAPHRSLLRFSYELCSGRRWTGN